MSSVRWPTGGANWQAQQLSRAERRDMMSKGGSNSHSWWWDSHNAPKNSKWLEDNLNDMDAKVKAMLKLIDEDADSFAKRAEMYYKKRPELVTLVEEFYSAYRSLAERYDQLTGHVRQIPQEIQVQYGLSGDSLPGSPGSGGSFRRRAAGFTAFASAESPRGSKGKGRKGGSDSPSSSGSDSDSDSKHVIPQQSDEMLLLQLDNENLRKNLEGEFAQHQLLESRLAEIQGELKSFQQENIQLHRNAASAHSEIAALEAEIEKLKAENRLLREEHTLALHTVERLQRELEIAQGEQKHVSIRLEETFLTITGHETRIMLLTKEMSQKIELQELFEKQVKDLELRLKVVQEALESCEKEKTSIMNKAENRLLGLQFEFDSVRERLNGEISLQVQEKQVLADKVMELNAALEASLREQSRVAVLQVASEKRIVVLELHHKQTDEALEAKEREKVELSSLLSNLESDLLSMQTKFSKIQENLISKNTTLAEQKQSLQLRIEELEAALAAFQGERGREVELQDVFEKRLMDYEQQLEQVQAALATSEKKRAGVVELLSKTEVALSALREESNSKQARMSNQLLLLAEEKQSLTKQIEAFHVAIEQLESKVGVLAEEKRKLHEQLLAAVRDSDELSAELLREKKELYEKLVVEGDHVLKLQLELKLLKEEMVKARRSIDDLQKEIERLNICIQEMTFAKDQQEKSWRDKLQFSAEEKDRLAKRLNETHQLLSLEKAEVVRLKEESDRKDRLVLKLEEDIVLLRANSSEKERVFTSSFSLTEQKVTDLLVQLGILTQEKENALSELHEKALLCTDKDEKIQKYLRLVKESDLRVENLEKDSAYISQKYDVTLAQLESVKLQLSRQQEENGRLGLEILARSVSVTELTKTVSNIEKQKTDLIVQLKKIQEDDLRLQEDNANLILQTKQLTQNLKSQAIKLGLLEEEIYNLRQVHVKLQTDHECISTEKQRTLDEHRLTLLSLDKLKEELVLQRTANERMKAEHARISDLQEEMDRLRQELTSCNGQLHEKTEKVKELLSKYSNLQEEKTALSMENERKIQAFGSLDASFCALKAEHVSLVDKYKFVTTEAAAGANLILKLKEEISQLSSDKEAQIQSILRRKADIQKHVQKTERLESELKRMELVVIGFTDEKISLSRQNASALSRCSDLEATCKSLQQQLGDQKKERERLEAQLSLIEELKKEAHDEEEMVRFMHQRVANKQHEIDQVRSINEDLKEISRKYESEVEKLKAQISVLQKKNSLLDEELSTKASLVEVMDQSLTSLKEQEIVFEGGLALAVGNLGLVQNEVDKLLGKISKLNESSIASAEDLRKMEDRICKLQVSNLNLRDEISAQAKKEKSYMIAVRFMRAEFFCLAQRIKAMKEEKLELAKLAELAMETERKKNEEALSGHHQELVFLREETERQRTIIFDRAEEKREAIRQLCATIDFMQKKNRRLENVIISVREKIERRIAASGARRR